MDKREIDKKKYKIQTQTNMETRKEARNSSSPLAPFMLHNGAAMFLSVERRIMVLVPGAELLFQPSRRHKHFCLYLFFFSSSFLVSYSLSC